MTALFPVVTGALLTAILGNFLVQRWQMRSWRAQQRQLGHQAELEELKRLVEEITTKASNRLNAMRRLAGSLAPGRAGKDEALAEYRNELTVWNTSLTSFFVRLRLYLSGGMAAYLEDGVHKGFYEAGRRIEELIRTSSQSRPVSWGDVAVIGRMLDSVQGQLNQFSRDLLAIVERKRAEVYYGRRLPYSSENLSEYSRLELIKALFTSNVNGFYIVRSA